MSVSLHRSSVPCLFDWPKRRREREGDWNGGGLRGEGGEGGGGGEGRHGALVDESRLGRR